MNKLIFTRFLFFLLLQNYLSAQNLIPNPGFEEHDEYFVSEWIQPAPPYYHFEYKYDSLSTPHSGDCFNGLCLRKNDENEYFQIKLKEKLKNGQRYHLQMYVRLWNHMECPLSHIDWFFSRNDSVMRKQKGYFWLTPLVKFYFPENANLKQWTLMETTYTANGTEQYLTVGNFVPEEETKNLIKLIETFKSENAHEVANTKKKRTAKDDIEFRKKMNAIPQKQRRLQNGNIDKSMFYFDDFCLSVLNDDGSYNCEDKLSALEADTPTEIKDIFFELGQAKLLKQSFPSLDSLFELLVKSPLMKIQINGHTDNKGTESMNLQLSENRAKSVVNYLISKGISPDRLTYKGFGSAMPRATNDTEEGRMQNRRVEFTVEK